MKILATLLLVVTTTATVDGRSIELITMGKRDWRYQYDQRVTAQAKAKSYKKKYGKCEEDLAAEKVARKDTSAQRIVDAEEGSPPESSTPVWFYLAGGTALILGGVALGWASAPTDRAD